MDDTFGFIQNPLKLILACRRMLFILKVPPDSVLFTQETSDEYMTDGLLPIHNKVATVCNLGYDA